MRTLRMKDYRLPFRTYLDNTNLEVKNYFVLNVDELVHLKTEEGKMHNS
jgi:hypothetical protein